MKKNLLFQLIFAVAFTANATDLQDSTLFDFWVGKWAATWDEGNGVIGKGTNDITKTLDGKVIQENFEIYEGASKGFKGTSLTVFNPQTKNWKQAWADNQGGYFDFTGELDGEKRIFKTAPKERNGKTIVQRMVFYNITDNKMTWDWEASQDGGKTWTLSWRINYAKVE